jgi:hypothetical protein
MAVAFEPFDTERERLRLRTLSDEQLIKEGKAARYLCSPAATFGKPPREEFMIGLKLCVEEWRRRHPGSILREK